MPKPQKTTFDAFIDRFCEFPISEQNRALELMTFEHRRARIRAVKQGARAEDLQAQKTATEALVRGPDHGRVHSVNLSEDKSNGKLRRSSGQPVTELLDNAREMGE